MVKLLEGDILASFALYPALIPFILMCLVSVLSLFRRLNINLKWVVILAISNVVIMMGHYILKMAGWAPWYDHAAANF